MPAFQLEFVPIAKVEENVGLYQYVAKKKARYFMVKFIEPLNPVEHDFGGLAAESSTGDQEVPNDRLYLPDLEMGQYLVIPLDDVYIKVKQPLAKSRWVTKGQITELRKRYYSYEPLKHMNLGQIFVFEDEKVFFDVRNPIKYPILKSRVIFPGFRFVLEELEVRPERFTWVPIEGW